MIDMSQKSVNLTINIRYPVTFDEDKVYEAMMPVINRYDMGIVKGEHKAPIYMPADSPLISTLMKVYREQTGACNRRGHLCESGRQYCGIWRVYAR